MKLEFSETERELIGRKARSQEYLQKVRQAECKTPVSVMPFFTKALSKLLRTMTIIKPMILLGRKQIYSCDKNYCPPKQKRISTCLASYTQTDSSYCHATITPFFPLLMSPSSCILLIYFSILLPVYSLFCPTCTLDKGASNKNHMGN